MIVDHPTLRFTGRYGTEAYKTVQCDFCSQLATPGENIEDAVEKARRSGFTTRPGIDPPASPRKWCCPACSRPKAFNVNGAS